MSSLERSRSKLGWWLSGGLLALALALRVMAPADGLTRESGALPGQSTGRGARPAASLEAAAQQEAGVGADVRATVTKDPEADSARGPEPGRALTIRLLDSTGGLFGGSVAVYLRDAEGQQEILRQTGAAPLALEGPAPGWASLRVFHDSVETNAAFEIEPRDQTVDVELVGSRVVEALLDTSGWEQAQREGFFRNLRFIVVTDRPRLDLNGGSAQDIIQNSPYGRQRWDREGPSGELLQSSEDHVMWLDVLGTGPRYAHLVCGEVAVRTVEIPEGADQIRFDLPGDELDQVLCTVRYEVEPVVWGGGRRPVTTSWHWVHDGVSSRDLDSSREKVGEDAWIFRNMNPGMFELRLRSEGANGEVLGTAVRGLLSPGDDLDVGRLFLRPLRRVSLRCTTPLRVEDDLSCFVEALHPTPGPPGCRDWLRAPLDEAGAVTWTLDALPYWLTLRTRNGSRWKTFVPAGAADLDLGDVELVPTELVRMLMPVSGEVGFYGLADLDAGTPLRTYHVENEPMVNLGLLPGRHRIELYDADRRPLGVREVQLEAGGGPVTLDLRE